MREELSEFVRDKKVLLLGFGREGKATYALLKGLGTAKSIGIADMNSIDITDTVTLHTGEKYLDCLDDYDIVFKSPGIVLPKPADSYRATITSEIEFFLKCYRNQVIGITGTKGKSTTSSLLYHVLKENDIPAVFAGNIGIPVFSIIDEIKSDTTVVLELSCHQLEICNYSPSTAVLLNLYEDHLDHYGTLENYHNAKRNIYRHQTKGDILYCTQAVKDTENNFPGKVEVIDYGYLPFSDLAEIDAKLFGKHNLLNCAFVYAISKRFNISDSDFTNAVKSFDPLPHRLQYFATKGGVDYYDDSISTTVESAKNAIKSVKNISTILLGGMERNIDYTDLVDFILYDNDAKKLENVICMYESGKRIYDLLKGSCKVNLLYTDDLEGAVILAKEVTGPNTACVLSPAAASYGYFKNFEERGDRFKELVLND